MNVQLICTPNNNETNKTEQRQNERPMKNIRGIGMLITLTVAASGALLLSGCSTTKGYKQADKTGEGIAEFRDEIVKGKEAVDATMKSLSDIAATANTDPRKAF